MLSSLERREKTVSILARVFLTLVVLVIGSLGTVVAAATPPDYEYKGETALTKEDYLELVREYDVGKNLVVLDVVDNVYTVHYDFKTEEKLDVLEGGVYTMSRIIYVVALVLGGLGTTVLASIPWLTDFKGRGE